MWHGWEELPNMLQSGAGPGTRCTRKNKKMTYFKLMLPNTRNELKVAIWANGTPKQFLLHIHTAMHVCKQISLDTKKANAMMVLEAAYCKLDAAKVCYANWQNYQKEYKVTEGK